MSNKRFIKAALAGKPKGKLRRQLDIPKNKKIPLKLLNRIANAKEGDEIRNPTKVGKRFIKVTALLERRAIFARTILKINRRRKR